MSPTIETGELPAGGTYKVGIPEINLSQKSGDTDYLNILAMDGGGIRGLIPAQVTDYLELKLYEVADS